MAFQVGALLQTRGLHHGMESKWVDDSGLLAGVRIGGVIGRDVRAARVKARVGRCSQGSCLVENVVGLAWKQLGRQ